MYKKVDLGHGLRLTDSDDMGIFIHFKSKSGHECGQFLGNTDDTMGHKWATELLADIPDEDDYKEMVEILKGWQDVVNGKAQIKAEPGEGPFIADLCRRGLKFLA